MRKATVEDVGSDTEPETGHSKSERKGPPAAGDYQHLPTTPSRDSGYSSWDSSLLGVNNTSNPFLEEHPAPPVPPPTPRAQSARAPPPAPRPTSSQLPRPQATSSRSPKPTKDNVVATRRHYTTTPARPVQLSPVALRPAPPTAWTAPRHTMSWQPPPYGYNQNPYGQPQPTYGQPPPPPQSQSITISVPTLQQPQQQLYQYPPHHQYPPSQPPYQPQPQYQPHPQYQRPPNQLQLPAPQQHYAPAPQPQYSAPQQSMVMPRAMESMARYPNPPKALPGTILCKPNDPRNPNYYFDHRDSHPSTWGSWDHRRKKFWWAPPHDGMAGGQWRLMSQPRPASRPTTRLEQPGSPIAHPAPQAGASRSRPRSTRTRTRTERPVSGENYVAPTWVTDGYQDEVTSPRLAMAKSYQRNFEREERPEAFVPESEPEPGPNDRRSRPRTISSRGRAGECHVTATENGLEIRKDDVMFGTPHYAPVTVGRIPRESPDATRSSEERQREHARRMSHSTAASVRPPRPRRDSMPPERDTRLPDTRLPDTRSPEARSPENRPPEYRPPEYKPPPA